MGLEIGNEEDAGASGAGKERTHSELGPFLRFLHRNRLPQPEVNVPVGP